MTAARVYPFPDRRSEQISVSRAALSAASENSLAASKSIADAVDRAMACVWANNRAGAIHNLERIGFEAQARSEALSKLTNIAERAPALEDGAFVPFGSAGAA